MASASSEQLSRLAWIVSVQRVVTLCQHCKQKVSPDPRTLEALSRRYPTLDVESLAGHREGTAYQALGCVHCRHTGHLGHVACFDVFRADCDPPRLFEQASLLSLERYVLGLAARGYLSLEDALHFERDQLRRTYRLFA